MALVMNTSLTDALATRIQPKLVDIGWSIGGEDSSPLSEYICLMIVNGKNQEQIASELSGDLLGLSPEDSSATEFSKWLFEQVDALKGSVMAEQQKTEPSNEQPAQQPPVSASLDHEMGDLMDEIAPQDGVPTAPKAMRQTNQPNRRLMNQLFKAMERKPDDPLHRVNAGTSGRIDTHKREPPKGPSKGPMRGGMNNNRPHQNRMGGGRNGFAGNFGNLNPQQQMQFYHMFQQQSQMLPFIPGQTPPPHMNMQMPGPMGGPMGHMGGPMGGPMNAMNGPMGGPVRGPMGGPMGGQMGGPMHHQIPIGMPMGPEDPYQNNLSQPRRAGGGGSLFDRIQAPPEPSTHNGGMDTSDDMSMDQRSSGDQGSQTPPNSKPEEIPCKFSAGCTKPECQFGHPSPAALPGRGAVYVSGERCPFAASCKNRKCTGSHPSPAAVRPSIPKPDQECRYFPNCTNPACPYKHPATTMPPCRNGPSCTRPGCHFTHAEIKCKFTPCLNPTCIYKHDEGQQKGSFEHKIWTAGGTKSHVSDRKFTSGEEGEEELIIPGQGLAVELEKDMDTAPVDDVE